MSFQLIQFVLIAHLYMSAYVILKNHVSCQPFCAFIANILLDRLKTGAISLVGRVGNVRPPFLVLPLTIEPAKPRLCYDARYLNLWMKDQPFTLDRLRDLPIYVSKDSYQTVLDDKSGYDHLLLKAESRCFFGFQWGGWYFTCNTLPFRLEDLPIHLPYYRPLRQPLFSLSWNLLFLVY